MEKEERYIRFFKLNQEGKEYILSISIYENALRLSCQENKAKSGSYYETDFTLDELIEINRYFTIMSSIYEAQNELTKAIEKQKVGIEIGQNLLNIVFYLIIGTDNVLLKLPLVKRDNSYKRIKFPEEQEPFTGDIKLKYKGNYPEDENRIINLEKYNKDLLKSQNELIEDVQNLMNLTEELQKETSFLFEENSKLNTRLIKIQKENNDRNMEVNSLKEEEQILNDENIKLKNYNAELEKILLHKKENLKKNLIENKNGRLNTGEIDLGNGPKAISSRFDTTQIKTFIPRITVKPVMEAYEERFTKSKKNPFYYTDNRRTNLIHSNYPTEDRFNRTDININVKQLRESGNRSLYNEKYNSNNNSFSNFNKEPIDNINKRKNRNKPKNPPKERITEKTDDYEDESKQIKPNQKFIFNKYEDDNSDYLSQSLANELVRDTDEGDYLFQKKGNETEEQSEIDEESHIDKYMNSDIVKSPMEESMLLNKLGKEGKTIKLKLLYKATIDSDKAEVFHKKCDKAKNTLVLIETINGNRFGGYTTQSWKGDGIDKKDNNAFVFSLDKLQLYNIIFDQPAIGCYPKYGPVFLGCQIKVNDNFFVKGGTTFRKNVNYAINSDFELNDGIKFFGIKDLEVFEVNLI